MVKYRLGQSQKKYWQNMRYLLMVLGILFFTVLVCTTLLINGTIASISALSGNLNEYMAANSLSFEPIGQAIQGNGNFFDALGDVFGGYAGLASTFIAGMGAGLLRFAGDLIVFIIIFFLGILISRDAVFILSRFTRETRGAVETWCEMRIKNVLILLYIVLIVYCFYVQFTSAIGIILLVLFPFVYVFLSLLGEWLSAGKYRPKFKAVITWKNMLVLLLENLILSAISLVIIVLLNVFLGLLVGLFTGIAILIMKSAAISLNAQAMIFDPFVSDSKDTDPEETSVVETKTVPEAEIEEKTEDIKAEESTETPAIPDSAVEISVSGPANKKFSQIMT